MCFNDFAGDGESQPDTGGCAFLFAAIEAIKDSR